MEKMNARAKPNVFEVTFSGGEQRSHSMNECQCKRSV